MHISTTVSTEPLKFLTKCSALALACLLSPLMSLAGTDDDLDFIAAQIQRAEAAQANTTLSTIIDRIEAEQGRYAADLVQPLTLVGDAQNALGNYSAAMDSYDRALHLNRANQGLFAPSQTAIVYRQAHTELKRGNLFEARQREEYAYDVLSRHHGEMSLQLLPALARLGDFYQRGFNFLGSRALFKRALAILESNGTRDSDAAVPFLQGIAKSYLTEGFPPYRYTPSQLDARSQSGMREQDLFREVGSINNFPAGERALQRVVAIKQRAFDDAAGINEEADNDAEMNPAELSKLRKSLNLAFLDLADWHQMFGHSREAKTLYKHLYAHAHEGLQQPTIAFEQPKLLYLPRPKDPKRPSDSLRQPEDGLVEVQFDVLPNGRIRDLQTLSSIPKGLMDFQVRRNLRDAIFRPALSADGPVLTKSYIYRHNFKYYPDQAPQDVAATSNPEPEK